MIFKRYDDFLHCKKQLAKNMERETVLCLTAPGQYKENNEQLYFQKSMCHQVKDLGFLGGELL